MLPRTLKLCRENGLDDLDIIYWIDECVVMVGSLFDNKAYDDTNKYVDKYGYTDFDKLLADFSEKEIRKVAWNYLKKDSNSREGTYCEIGDYFVAVDVTCDYEVMEESPEFDFDDLKKWKRVAFGRGFFDEYDLKYA